jgi:esterase/lipase superfamily enzyme
MITMNRPGILFSIIRLLAGLPSRESASALLAVVLLALIPISFTACTSYGPHSIDLMPAPDIYDQSGLNPFSDRNPISKEATIDILFATDREPATEDNEEKFYRNERGYLLRLGVGNVQLGAKNITWDELKRVSLLKKRTDKFPLQVNKIHDLGILDTSFSVFDPPEMLAEQSITPANQFAGLINEKLARSQRKDVYVYVHGFKVNFENPLLVASELWHYLGYRGAFIAFAWPSTPSVWAYASDLETASLSSRNLRLLLEFVAKETDAENIHILGYSAGSRLVVQALGDLALMHFNTTKKTINEKLKIKHVILVGSDVDRDIFGNAFLDGLLKVPQNLSIYVSEIDEALGMSFWFFARPRLGQLVPEKPLDETAVDLLRKLDDLDFINVTKAEGAGTGNGHAYFRKSPWASSDILTTLLLDLKPSQRGLVRTEDVPIWTFPFDYISRLRSALQVMKKSGNEDRALVDPN